MSLQSNELNEGASDKSDRAVVNGAASVSAVPASIPSAGALLEVLEPDDFGNYLKGDWAVVRYTIPSLEKIIVSIPGRRFGACLYFSEQDQVWRRATPEALGVLRAASLGFEFCSFSLGFRLRVAWKFLTDPKMAARIVMWAAEQAAQAIEAGTAKDRRAWPEGRKRGPQPGCVLNTPPPPSQGAE